MSALLDPTQLHALYAWIDTIPLSRPKKNIARDFSDGQLVSEVIGHLHPRLIDLHNYSKSNSTQQKQYNWKTMNQKVFRRLGMVLSPSEIDAIVTCERGRIEEFLLVLKNKLEEYDGGTGTTAAAAVQPRIQETKTTYEPQQIYTAPPTQQQPQPVAPTRTTATQGQRRKTVPAATGTPIRSQPASPITAAPAVSRTQAQPHPAVTRPSHPQSHPQPQQSHSQSHPSPVLPPAASHPVITCNHEPLLHDLRETVDILQIKVTKLEQLVKLKNAKIETLQAKLQAAGIS